MPFHQAGVFLDIGLVQFQFLYFAHYFGKDVGDGLVVAAAYAMEEGISWFGIQLDCGYSCPVLAPVMLFFHQEVQLVQTVQDCAVFL